MNIVDMDAISKSYNGAKALDDVSLQIDGGERIVILGPSGCGKTTILRLIAGFIAPDAGSISVGGEVVSKNGRIITPPEQRNLGMVFQDLALWPHLSVKGNIEFGLKAQGIQKSVREGRIRNILKLVVWLIARTGSPLNCQGGSSSAWPSQGHWCLNPRYY